LGDGRRALAFLQIRAELRRVERDTSKTAKITNADITGQCQRAV